MGEMKKILLVLALTALPNVLYAQATPTSKLAWDQAAPTLTDANGYTYKYYPDGAATGVTLASVTCTGSSSPYACQVNYPAFTPGNHTLQLTATNAAGESVKSSPFAFAFVVIPAAPANIRIG